MEDSKPLEFLSSLQAKTRPHLSTPTGGGASDVVAEFSGEDGGSSIIQQAGKPLCVICGAPATMECPCHPRHQYCGEEHQLRHWEEGHSETHDEEMQERARRRRKRQEQDGMSPKGDRRKRRRKAVESEDSEERVSE